jgi:hypothetical protein
MTKLRECFECNRMLSSEARKCPHCATNFPHGVSCQFCSNIVKEREVLTVGTSISRSGKLCKSCHSEISKSFQESPIQKYSCPACAKQYEFHYDYERSTSYGFSIFRAPKRGAKTTISHSCDSCGHPNAKSFGEYPYANCFVCDLILSKKTSIKLAKGIYEHNDEYVHEFCRDNCWFSIEEINAKRKAEIAEIEKKKDEAKQKKFWQDFKKELPGTILFFGLSYLSIKSGVIIPGLLFLMAGMYSVIIWIKEAP